MGRRRGAEKLGRFNGEEKGEEKLGRFNGEIILFPYIL